MTAKECCGGAPRCQKCPLGQLPRPEPKASVAIADDFSAIARGMLALNLERSVPKPPGHSREIPQLGGREWKRLREGRFVPEPPPWGQHILDEIQRMHGVGDQIAELASRPAPDTATAVMLKSRHWHFADLNRQIAPDGRSLLDHVNALRPVAYFLNEDGVHAYDGDKITKV